MTLNLIKTVETYRAESESEAQTFIDEQKDRANSGEFELKKYVTEKKQVKSKGEVVEEFYLVTVTKNFDV
jgi:hypothetical protein